MSGVPIQGVADSRTSELTTVMLPNWASGPDVQ
jgi:hypothetical protein